jgi:hypothetical protein
MKEEGSEPIGLNRQTLRVDRSSPQEPQGNRMKRCSSVDQIAAFAP